MKDRNRLFIRSIGFGIISKLVGASVVFFGIPIIASRLSVLAFKEFLLAMSASSLTALCFGALGISSVQTLASLEEDRDELVYRRSVANLAGAYVVCGVIASVILLLIVGFPSGYVPKPSVQLAAALSILQGVFQIGDAIRVSRREDYITSSIQILGSIFLMACLVFIKNISLLGAVILYFGMPCFVYGIVLIDLMTRERFFIAPSFIFLDVVRSFRRIIPFIVNSFVEYMKIFGAGVLLSLLVSPRAYVAFQAALLMIARFINPISLITRPLLPAYIDAVKNNDFIWLNRFKSGMIGFYVVGLFFAILINLIFEKFMGHLNLSQGIFSYSFIDRTELMIFFVGQIFVVLALPVFVARGEVKAYIWVNAICTGLSVVGGLVVTLLYASAMLAAVASGVTAASSVLMLIVALRQPDLRRL